MSHDDGNKTDEFQETDIILLGVSRTSKTPTSIYLANRGYKTMNIPLIPNQSIPMDIIKNSFNKCIIGLIADPQRLSEIRRNRVALMKDNVPSYADIENIKKELDESLSLFKKNGWPIIDVTRKSVEETAASIIKIYDIKNKKMRIILASKSGVRKKILEENGIEFDIIPSQVDEDMAKESLLNEGADPFLISKNLAELKSN